MKLKINFFLDYKPLMRIESLFQLKNDDNYFVYIESFLIYYL